ncbi:maternal effect protein oskar-like isoform X1 [Onthophagus taurus]|uniref:maternal effect protein oskar-like isoform X1 n=2 Tax=Onthophagus taurus TaxID=166361 RepID=UPI0039BE20CD
MDQNSTPIIKVPSRVVKSEPKKTKRRCMLDFSLPRVATKTVGGEIEDNVDSRLGSKKYPKTPERLLLSTPKCASTPGKRKSSWNDDHNRVKRAKTTENNSIVPLYEDYQLLGDSQLMRFSEQLLSFKSLYSDGIRRIGYCVSGQKIDELKKRLLKGEFEIHKNVILLIGTNDFIQKTDYQVMCSSYTQLLQFLKLKCSKIILMTVPPVAKFESDKKHWKLLQQFNQFIGSFIDGDFVNVIDLCSIFISYSNTVSMDYYEKQYIKPARPDLIHLNKKGFMMLRFMLDTHFLEANINNLMKPLKKKLFPDNSF